MKGKDMSAKNAAAVDVHMEDYYVKGYDPVSLHAPHSSLLKVSTWVGMGTILSTIPCAGIILFGLSSAAVGSQEYASTYAIIGVVLTILMLAVGVALVHYGRRDYRKYKARSGRVN